MTGPVAPRRSTGQIFAIVALISSCLALVCFALAHLHSRAALIAAFALAVVGLILGAVSCVVCIRQRLTDRWLVASIVAIVLGAGIGAMLALPAIIAVIDLVTNGS
jgi:hypothetical protein